MQQSVIVGEKHSAALNPTPSPLVIIATAGTSGDMLPFITLSQGLLERGHRVLMLVPRFHAAMLQASEVPFQTFGTHAQFQAVLDDPDLWDERKGWGVLWNGLAPNLGALQHCIAQLPVAQPCVVLSHPLLVPMSAMARSVRPNLRIVAAYLAPSNLFSSHDMLSAGSLRIPRWTPIRWRQALWKLIHKGWIGPATLPSLNGARALSGLPAVPDFFAHILTAPNASLGLFPSWYASVQTDWPKPFTEGDFVGGSLPSQATLAPGLAQFLSHGSPPIVFTPGTGHQHAARYFHIALKTLLRLGRRGVFVTPHAAQLPDSLPSTVMWQSHVPFALLLPHAAAVVHHGGIGTTAEAFRTGTPQLVVPFAYDQFDNGLRAKGLGVADVLLAKRLSVGRMQKKLAQLLACADVARTCSSIAQKMAQNSNLAGLLDQTEAALFAVR